MRRDVYDRIDVMVTIAVSVVTLCGAANLQYAPRGISCMTNAQVLSSGVVFIRGVELYLDIELSA